MAGNVIKIDKRQTNAIDFVVDTEAEVAYLPTTTSKGTGDFANKPEFDYTVGIGSTCIVKGTDSIIVYMLFSDGWMKI